MENPTFKIAASYLSRDPNAAQHVEITAKCSTVEAAREIAALFPKSMKVRATTLTSYATGEAVVTGIICFRAGLRSDGVNGGRNETGIKRYRSLVAKLAKHGFSTEYVAQWSNAYPTLEAFEAAIA
jgi:hypothetical protein